MAAVPSIGRAYAPRELAPAADTTQDLYSRYAKQIYKFCLNQLRNREEAEDATQTTFLNAFRGLERGVSLEYEAAWLYKIAHHVCLSRQRSSSRRRRVEGAEDFDAIQELVPSAPRESDELFGLKDALRALPEQQRRAVLLREFQGLSYKEIAAELDLSQAAVETLLFRARRSLALGLGDRGTPGDNVQLRGAGDLSSLFAALKTLIFTGGVKVVAGLATVAATTAVATPAPRHAIARFVDATTFRLPASKPEPVLTETPADVTTPTADPGAPIHAVRGIALAAAVPVATAPVARNYRAHAAAPPVHVATRPEPKVRTVIVKAVRVAPVEHSTPAPVRVATRRPVQATPAPAAVAPVAAPAPATTPALAPEEAHAAPEAAAPTAVAATPSDAATPAPAPAATATPAPAAQNTPVAASTRQLSSAPAPTPAATSSTRNLTASQVSVTATTPAVATPPIAVTGDSSANQARKDEGQPVDDGTAGKDVPPGQAKKVDWTAPAQPQPQDAAAADPSAGLPPGQAKKIDLSTTVVAQVPPVAQAQPVPAAGTAVETTATATPTATTWSPPGQAKKDDGAADKGHKGNGKDKSND